MYAYLVSNKCSVGFFVLVPEEFRQRRVALVNSTLSGALLPLPLPTCPILLVLQSFLCLFIRSCRSAQLDESFIRLLPDFFPFL